MAGCKTINFPISGSAAAELREVPKSERVSFKIDVGDEQAGSKYSCLHITEPEDRERWVIFVTSKCWEDVPKLLARARNVQKAGVEVTGATL